MEVSLGGSIIRATDHNTCQQDSVTVPETTEILPTAEAISEPSELIPCPVCGSGASECALKNLTGKIQGITFSDNSHYACQIMTSDFEPIQIKIHPSWNSRAPKWKALLDLNHSIPVTILHVEKDGDELQIGQDSLVVIEPDWLINVTDMTKVEYCQRKFLLNRFIPSPSNKYMIRGNVVHGLFPEIWHSKRGEELELSRQELLQGQVDNFITAQSSPEEIRSECDYAIEHITQWVDQRKRSTNLRTETFVLSPSLGMKGRIDALWEDPERGHIIGVGELKTGKSQGKNPKPGDALQLLSYALMLFARGEISLKEIYAGVLYSGNPKLGDQGNNFFRRVIPDLESIKRAVNIRNDLVLVELTGQAHFESNLNKCRACQDRSHCALVGLLGDEKDTRSVETKSWLRSDSKIPSINEKAFFRHYSRLISDELQALKEMHARLWRKSSHQRESEGAAFKVSNHVLDGQRQGRYQYRLEGCNASEFRTGDSVLTSDHNGPAGGRVALGTVQQTSQDHLQVSAGEEICFKPVWVDPYTSENLTIRLFGGLYRWISRPSHLSELILSGQSPEFGRMPLEDRSFLTVLRKERLNEFQGQALRAAICAKAYAIIHGPPGSGKTKLIKAIVRAHLLLGQRVLLCTGTNRALDEALKPLVKGPLGEKSLRIGSLASITDEDIKSIALQHLIKDHATVTAKIFAGQEAVRNKSVVGITASSLLSGSYDAALGEFDLVIIDEAAQLTVPATLGCISFGKRFVLIGDHNQLPAVVQSESIGSDEGDGAGGQWPRLSKSLFQILYDRCEKNSGREVIFLKDQYRMNDHICSIPGAMWYQGDLRPANSLVGKASLKLNQANLSDFAKTVLDPNESVKFVNVPLDNTEGPRTNLKEAEVVCDIVKALVSGGFFIEGKASIAIICPRKAQVELVRRRLERLLRENRLCDRETEKMLLDSVSTVDRFQGSQSDVVIVSLGMSDGAVSDHLTDEKRLNVAMSRARHKLVLLGNRDTLAQEPVFRNLFRTMAAVLPYAEWCVEVNGS